jgi:ABC-2 type transport system permease protein
MIRVELEKQWRRPRTVFTLAALVLFTIALTVALVAAGPGTLERVGDIPLLVVPNHSGFSVPVIALSSTMKFFLPLAVAIFAGESVSGEAGWGSLRYALARPGSRAGFLASKLTVALGLSLVAVVLVPAAAIAVGTIAFGWHPFSAIDGSSPSALHATVVHFGTGATVSRLAVSAAYVAGGMTSIFAFAFLLSTITSSAFAAVAGGVGLTIVSRVLNADYLPGVAVVNKYMPNNDVDLWQHFFQQPADTSVMARFLILQLVYVVVFLSIAFWWFSRKDVLT